MNFSDITSSPYFIPAMCTFGGATGALTLNWAWNKWSGSWDLDKKSYQALEAAFNKAVSGTRPQALVPAVAANNTVTPAVEATPEIPAKPGVPGDHTDLVKLLSSRGRRARNNKDVSAFLLLLQEVGTLHEYCCTDGVGITAGQEKLLAQGLLEVSRVFASKKAK